MDVRSRENPAPEIVFNILDNKLACIAQGRLISPFLDYAKKHEEEKTIDKARDLFSEVVFLCSRVKGFFEKRLGHYDYYANRCPSCRIENTYNAEGIVSYTGSRWYTGNPKIRDKRVRRSFAEKDIIELLKIINNHFNTVMNRCDPDYIHLRFIKDDNDIMAKLVEISKIFASMLAEAEEIYIANSTSSLDNKQNDTLDEGGKEEIATAPVDVKRALAKKRASKRIRQRAYYGKTPKQAAFAAFTSLNGSYTLEKDASNTRLAHQKN